MTAYAIIAFMCVINASVGYFGSMAGFTVNGMLEGGEASWVWTDMVGFLWNLSTFNVDDMPVFLTLAFLIFNIVAIFVIIRVIRGVQ